MLGRVHFLAPRPPLPCPLTGLWPLTTFFLVTSLPSHPSLLPISKELCPEKQKPQLRDTALKVQCDLAPATLS